MVRVQVEGSEEGMTTLREAAQNMLNVLDALIANGTLAYVITPDRIVDIRDEAANLRAALAQPDEPAQPVKWRVELDSKEVALLHGFTTPDDDEHPAIVLDLGRTKDDDGTEEYGLRVWLADYPEEGAIVLKELAAPPATAAPARLTDEYFAKLWLASTSDVDVSKSFAALAFHYGRAVEDEVRRRMEVSA